MKRNNRGFTLVELIVSIAILGIIAVAVSSFLLAGTRSYTKVNYAVRLQYETQLAMNQIQSYVMNCSRGIAWDGSKLYVDGSGTDDTALKEISYDAANKKLLLGSGTASEAGIQTTALNLMAEHVTGLTVEFNQSLSSNVKTATAQWVKITLTMESGGRSYTGEQTIALRNKPLCSQSWSDLWKELNKTPSEGN